MNGYVAATYVVTLLVLGATAVRIVITQHRLQRHFARKDDGGGAS
jgi:hypothetical protein